jgi:hypothetical protein
MEHRLPRKQKANKQKSKKQIKRQNLKKTVRTFGELVRSSQQKPFNFLSLHVYTLWRIAKVVERF